MKFKYVKKVKEPVLSYGNMVSTGDTVEYKGHFAEKAKRNPNYEIVEDGDKGGTAGSSAGIPGPKGSRPGRVKQRSS